MIAALNINSLVAHIDELRVFMSSSEIDILAINETKLNFSVDNNEIHLQGFDIVRKDRITNGRNGGGVCIYVRDNLNYIIRDDLSPDGLQCLIIEITNPHSKPFLVGTWYRPPDSLASKFLDFEDIIAKIDSENRELFLLGDINVDLLPEVEAPSARKLKDIFDVYGLHQLIAEPTRVTQFSQTLIDLCITNSPLSIVKSGVVQLSISDHALVYMTRKARYDRCGARIIQARCMKSFNQEGGGVSRVNIGRLITTSVTSRHTSMFFQNGGQFSCSLFLQKMTIFQRSGKLFCRARMTKHLENRKE